MNGVNESYPSQDVSASITSKPHSPLAPVWHSLDLQVLGRRGIRHQGRQMS